MYRIRNLAACVLGYWLLASASVTLAQPKTAIVLNSGEGTVSVVDMVARKEVKRIPVGKEPHHILATLDDKHVLVANSVSNNVVVLDPANGEVRRRIERVSNPYHLAFSPDKKFFVTASFRLSQIDIYDARSFDDAKELKLLKRISAPKTPSHIVFDAESTTAFVTLQDSEEVVAIDLATQQPRWKIKVGPVPAGIWMTPDNRHLLVGLTGADGVDVIDWRKPAVVSRITTGKGAHNFLGMGDKRHVLITNRVENSIAIIDQQSLKVIDKFPVPGGPDCMELTRDGKELWVTSRWIQKVSVVDMTTKKVIAQIPVGRSPHGIFFQGHAPRQ